ncbi:MAG TPA: NAD(P)H-hydrate dehydratase [Thermoanaerobaculia bacterium]|nr:NAD(P)H-hydrate dehydratase [Thermoanaerobaculia bacterium]
MRVLTAEGMRAVDRAAIDELGVPGLVLMENAALGVVEAIGEVFPRAASAAVFCGPGNNGGDGLAVARHLAVRGYRVETVLAAGGRALGGDAAVQLGICRALELPLAELPPDADLGPALAAARDADLVVDALFGTGLARPLAGQPAALVAALNELPRPRVAVDLPSGLSGSRAEVWEPHLRADLTVTFAAPKVAHVLPPAADSVGELVVADLGIPSWVVEGAPGALHLLVEDEAAALLPPRPPGAHKGDCGHALLIAGSAGKAGAALLAARGAVRGGAGLVTVAVPEPLLAAVDLASLESMTLALPARPDGSLAEGAVERVRAALAGKGALALGPGLGTQPETAAAVRRIARESPVPLVVDADGLNAFAGHLPELAARMVATILTPHPGEMGRLLGIPTAEVEADRLGAAERAARETGAVVLLKGRRTLVATPEGAVWVIPTGNPGMATGGTGDVLTGLLAALLAQGLEPLDAALAGAYVHGLAGDLAAERQGTRGLSAGDLAEALPAAFRRLAAAGAP